MRKCDCYIHRKKWRLFLKPLLGHSSLLHADVGAMGNKNNHFSVYFERMKKTCPPPRSLFRRRCRKATAAATKALATQVVNKHDKIAIHAAIYNYCQALAKSAYTRSCRCSLGVSLQLFFSSGSSSACCIVRFRMEHCSSQRGPIWSCGHLAAERRTRDLRWWLRY
jgi:hypothetical protein